MLRDHAALTRWVRQIVVDPDGSRYGFEWLVIADHAWRHRAWRSRLVTSHVRRGSNEGHLIQVRVDGSLILEAKCLYWDESVHLVVGALLVRVFQSRVTRAAATAWAKCEAFDREMAEIMGRHMGAWFARNERRASTKASASVTTLARKE